VIQTQSCVENKLVFYSLGNHLFDQKYPSTHKGMAIECDFTPESFSCEGKETQRERGSSSPRWTKVTIPQLPCGKRVKDPQSSGRRWRAVNLEKGRALLNLEKGFVHYQSSEFDLRYFSPIDLGDGRRSFFLGHVAFSTFDNKAALRPAVYAEKDNRLVPVWKGTTLAYPTEDFELVSSAGEKVLCAFHGPVGHFLGKFTPNEERVMVYKWNGFGFSKDQNTAHLESCRQWALEYAFSD
jgi:poly-gamma-glutamate synthesis protein (capsule biosynthesis protein)